MKVRNTEDARRSYERSVLIDRIGAFVIAALAAFVWAVLI